MGESGRWVPSRLRHNRPRNTADGRQVTSTVPIGAEWSRLGLGEYWKEANPEFGRAGDMAIELQQKPIVIPDGSVASSLPPDSH